MVTERKERDSGYRDRCTETERGDRQQIQRQREKDREKETETKRRETADTEIKGKRQRGE